MPVLCDESLVVLYSITAFGFKDATTVWQYRNNSGE
jgi:hypothetical protein